MHFKYSDAQSALFDKSFTIYKLVEESSDILQKLISIFHNNLDIRHSTWPENTYTKNVLESRKRVTTYMIMNSLPYYHILLCDINCNIDYDVTDYVVNDKWIVGYAIVKPCKETYFAIHMFDIFLNGHNFGEYLYKTLCKIYNNNLLLHNVLVSRIEYWSKLDAFTNIKNILSNLSEADKINFLKNNLNLNEEVISYIT